MSAPPTPEREVEDVARIIDPEAFEEKLRVTWHDSPPNRPHGQRGYYTLDDGQTLADFDKTRMGIALTKARLILSRRAGEGGEGWVLVPREPTEAMCRAGVAAGVHASPKPWAPITWAAMIASAPPHPQDSKEEGSALSQEGVKS